MAKSVMEESEYQENQNIISTHSLDSLWSPWLRVRVPNLKLCYFLVSKYYNYDQLGRLPCKMQLKFPSTIRGRNLKAQQSPVILDH